MIYCVVPQVLVDELYDRLVDYYREDPNVKVIIDRREGADRRGPAQRRRQRREEELEAHRREVRDRRQRRMTGSFPPIEPAG